MEVVFVKREPKICSFYELPIPSFYKVVGYPTVYLKLTLTTVVDIEDMETDTPIQPNRTEKVQILTPISITFSED